MIKIFFLNPKATSSIDSNRTGCHSNGRQFRLREFRLRQCLDDSEIFANSRFDFTIANQ